MTGIEANRDRMLKHENAWRRRFPDLRGRQRASTLIGNIVATSANN
jgi:hypothetical protein